MAFLTTSDPLVQTFPASSGIRVGDISSITTGDRPAAIVDVTNGEVGALIVGIIYNENQFLITALATPFGEQARSGEILLAVTETISYVEEPESLQGQIDLRTFTSQDCLLRFRYPSEFEVQGDIFAVANDDYRFHLSNSTSSLVIAAEQVPAGEVHVIVTIQSTGFAGTDPEAFIRRRFPRVTQVSRGAIEARPAVSAVVRQEASEQLYLAFLYDSATMALIEVIAAPNEVGDWEATAEIIAESIEVGEQ